jgi:hypothetical protein
MQHDSSCELEACNGEHKQCLCSWRASELIQLADNIRWNPVTVIPPWKLLIATDARGNRCTGFYDSIEAFDLFEFQPVVAWTVCPEYNPQG